MLAGWKIAEKQKGRRAEGQKGRRAEKQKSRRAEKQQGSRAAGQDDRPRSHSFSSSLLLSFCPSAFGLRNPPALLEQRHDNRPSARLE
jgi:hypothetical protein